MQTQDARASVWSAAILCQPYSSLSYALPPYLPVHVWHPGMRVLVPMGQSNKLCCAVLERSVPALPTEKKLKSIFWPLEKEAVLSADYLEMLENVAARQLTSLGRVLASVLPASLRRVPDGWRDRKNKKIPFSSGRDNREFLSRLAEFWMQGELDVKSPGDKEPVLTVSSEPPWPIRPQARVQWAVMDLLYAHGPRTASSIRAELGQGSTKALQALQDKELVCPCKPGDEPEGGSLEAGQDFCFSPEQKEALKHLSPRLRQGFGACLLHGITGSGKTLVYLDLARQSLEMGRSAILLAPEIAIARQLYQQARQYLPGAAIYLHHGSKGPSSKEKTFVELGQEKKPVLLIGTRSALFMPVQDTGLIVLDEEHDESFKQDQTLIYQAKEIAWYLASREEALLVLGSATPDVKTFHAAQAGHVSLVEMHSRIGKSTLPQVDFVDLKNDPPVFGALAKTCAEALKETVKRGEQAVIMHNRRGYSPVLMCESCSETVKCANCQVGLTYHKKRNRLVCHYCGISVSFPPVCRHCRGSEFIPVGQGTEKVEEFLARHLPDTQVLRLDRDSTRSPGKAEKILQDFAQGQARILVGTQMLSKGHSFPEVTLAIVLDGDLGLGLPDYRSSERIFQLLVQLSGRSGRGEKPGRVFIQTRNPGHFCWQYIRDCDYKGFFQQEISRRQKFGYPPFVRLGLIRFSFPDTWEGKADFLAGLRKKAKQAAAGSKVTMLGPAPAVLSRLKNRERHQFLVKSSDWAGIKQAYLELRPLFDSYRQVRASLDLDPVNML